MHSCFDIDALVTGTAICCSLCLWSFRDKCVADVDSSGCDPVDSSGVILLRELYQFTNEPFPTE